MKITNVIFGIIIATIGVIGYLNVIIVSLFSDVAGWISDILNAPESLAVIITLLLIWEFIGLILIIAIIAIYTITIGLIMIQSD